MILPRFNRNLIAAVHDAVMAAASFGIAIWLRLGDQWHAADEYMRSGTLLFTTICVAVFVMMRLYRGLWRYASMQDMLAIVKAVTLSILVFALVMFTVNRLEGVPRSVLFINWMLLMGLLAGPRFVYRAVKDRVLRLPAAPRMTRRIPVLLVGAGDQAEQFIRDLGRDATAPYEVIGLVDDDRQQKGRTIHRVSICGTTERLPQVVKRLARQGRRPQKLIVTDERITGERVRRLLEIADGLGIPLARLPSLSELKQGFSDGPQLRPIAIEDLLMRAQHVLDRDHMKRLVEGRKVLVTGAGGTIGGELARQIASYRPGHLTLFDISEFNLYQIEREIRGAFPGLPVSAILGDVRDARHLDLVFGTFSPELVFHAAAIKHVPIAEDNIEETILTNVFGTHHVAECCRRHRAAIMVLISTDKAVNPANVMGATKRLAENICQALGAAEKSGETRFITVRFGNVLGSSGSVVPLFSEQLARGGPLTVTHPDITRYFMTVREAVELVLQAATLGAAMKDRQECVLVLDMGQPVRILDLAEQMIRLAGLTPHEDIKITFTGLRPGEKLYEELFLFSENAVKTTHESIFLASPHFPDMAILRKSLETLRQACLDRRSGEALDLLKKLVPELQALHRQAGKIAAA
ncbi:MAG: polysaccharide biosynthesis protein [Pseudomonadota bacterium]|nr:polysaccharide biosynthesis protein [Pseudomonadota bacterium]